jgi:hypothetical protein
MELLTVADSVTEIGAQAFDGIPNTAQLHVKFKFKGVLDTKTGKKAWVAALRGAVARYCGSAVGEPTIDDMKWIEYIDSLGAELLPLLGEEPFLYRYLTSRRLIGTESIDAILEKTRSPECRAILLEYSRESGAADTDTDIEGRFELS